MPGDSTTATLIFSREKNPDFCGLEKGSICNWGSAPPGGKKPQPLWLALTQEIDLII